MTDETPTTRWLAAAANLPPLEGPAGTAERLLLLIHYGIDWTGDGWVTRHRRSYWDRLLVDRRVITATYRSATLRGWWADVAGELQSAPRSAEERHELEHLLRGDDIATLELLRSQSEALLLRTRIVADAVRAARDSRKDA